MPLTFPPESRTTDSAAGRRRRAVTVAARLALLASVLVAVTPALAPPAAAEVSSPPGAEVAFRITDPSVTESSGLVASELHEGVVWTHNDGDEGVLYAVGPDGETIATYRLAGVDVRDWEALAYGYDERGRPALYVGDIGDNSHLRERGILVHRVTEPASLDGGTLEATSYRLRYPARRSTPKPSWSTR